LNVNKYLKKNVEYLKNLNLKPKSLKWNKDFIFNGKFKNNVVFIRGIKDYQNSLIYRARSLGVNEDVNSPNTFKYPPLKFNNIGRANLKAKQVLYAATCPATSILEYLNTGNAGKEVYLSIWKYNSDKVLDTFYIIENPHNLKKLKEIYYKYSTIKTLNLINEIYLNLIKLYKSNNYSFTAPYSHFILYTNNLANMIRYPSVVTDSQSYNYAINIDFFDNNFCLDMVYKLNVLGKINMNELENNNDLIVITEEPIEVGRIKNGKIIYEKPNKEDLKFWKKLHPSNR